MTFREHVDEPQQEAFYENCRCEVFHSSIPGKVYSAPCSAVDRRPMETHLIFDIRFDFLPDPIIGIVDSFRVVGADGTPFNTRKHFDEEIPFDTTCILRVRYILDWD